jgi:hypothetical protein
MIEPTFPTYTAIGKVILPAVELILVVIVVDAPAFWAYPNHIPFAKLVLAFGASVREPGGVHSRLMETEVGQPRVFWIARGG